jgi:hypothetical protein
MSVAALADHPMPVSELRALAASLRDLVGPLDPAAVPLGWALPTYQSLDEIARLADAGKTLLAARVAESGAHKQRGLNNPAELLAAVSGTSLGAAKGELATSGRLAELPATRAALTAGDVSAAQGRVIADAAATNPEAEASLLAAAERANLQELREKALRAKAAADPDPEATEARIHAARRCGASTDAEGASHLHAVATPAQMSDVVAELDALGDQIFRANARAGSMEPREAYSMDALQQMARNSRAFRLGHLVDGAVAATPATDGSASKRKRRRQPPTSHTALLRLDVSALWRGHVEGDELCEIVGLGPISVPAARGLLGDAALKLILTKGKQVVNVTSLRRGPDQAMRYALLWMQPHCVAEGCSRARIEHDHRTGVEYRTTKHTRLDELDGLCPCHHKLHTFHGWALVPGPPGEKRPMVPPDDPRHPLAP